jgi:flagellar biogenesis protein FliO
VWIIIFALIAVAGGVSIWARRHPSARGSRLPECVFQVLGRQQIGPGQSVVFARLGDRVLLLSATSDGLRTLVDIDDPAEATRLTAECLAAASRGGRQAAPRVQLAPNTSPVTAPSFLPAASRIDHPRTANPASSVAGDHLRDVAARPDRLALARSREREHG